MTWPVLYLIIILCEVVLSWKPDLTAVNGHFYEKEEKQSLLNGPIFDKESNQVSHYKYLAKSAINSFIFY